MTAEWTSAVGSHKIESTSQAPPSPPAPHLTDHRHDHRCSGAADVLAAVPGLTYRQLDWWTIRGYVHANEDHPGAGVYRCWSDLEVDVIRRAHRLVDLGMAARHAVDRARADDLGDLLGEMTA